MVNDHDLDLITLQEGTSKADVDGIIGEDWESIVTSEKPIDMAIDGHGCGLRISEATQLKTSDIDRPHMQLRVRNGKGAKGRHYCNRTAARLA